MTTTLSDTGHIEHNSSYSDEKYYGIVLALSGSYVSGENCTLKILFLGKFFIYRFTSRPARHVQRQDVLTCFVNRIKSSAKVEVNRKFTSKKNFFLVSLHEHELSIDSLLPNAELMHFHHHYYKLLNYITFTTQMDFTPPWTIDFLSIIRIEMVSPRFIRSIFHPSTAK